MAQSDHLNRYAQGWMTGDPGVIVDSLDAGYELDDPNVGTISKGGFPAYFAALKEQVDAVRQGTSGSFMEVSDVVTQEEQGVLTAWGWWSIPGTPIQGSGLIKVGEAGVLSERLAYYTKLHGG